MSARRPRYRYVAFEVLGPRAFAREELIEALRGLPSAPWLVEFRGSIGLVRCTNLTKEETIRRLGGISSIGGQPVRVVTIGTSGTIRRAEQKYLRRRPSRPSSPGK